MTLWLLSTIIYLIMGWSKFVEMVKLELSITPEEKIRFGRVKPFVYTEWKPDLNKLATELRKVVELHTEQHIQQQETMRQRRIL